MSSVTSFLLTCPASYFLPRPSCSIVCSIHTCIIVFSPLSLPHFLLNCISSLLPLVSLPLYQKLFPLGPADPHSENSSSDFQMPSLVSPFLGNLLPNPKTTTSDDSLRLSTSSPWTIESLHHRPWLWTTRAGNLI